MKRIVRGFAGSALFLILAAGQAFVHHAASAAYLHGKSVTIEGTLKEFVWRNLHSFMKVEARGDKGTMQVFGD